MDKRYLGDGVYAYFDGFHVVLYTDRDSIYFEDKVAIAAINYFNEAFDWTIKDDDQD